MHAGTVQNNTLENLTALLTWRASGFAIFGGANNTDTNLCTADQPTYPGVTVSSINFGISLFQTKYLSPSSPTNPIADTTRPDGSNVDATASLTGRAGNAV